MDTNTTPLKLDVGVKLVEPTNNLLGFASVTINDCFKVHGLKIVNGENGRFVNMPSAKTNQLDNAGNPVYQDVCHPITGAFREQLVSAVLDGYDKAIEKMQAAVQTAENSRRAPLKPRIVDQIRENTQAAQAHPAPPRPAAARTDAR